MTKSELKKFREILEARQAELELFVRNREGIAIEKSPDALDEVQHAAERELAIRNLDRESQLLRNVRGALRRLDAVWLVLLNQLATAAVLVPWALSLERWPTGVQLATPASGVVVVLQVVPT